MKIKSVTGSFGNIKGRKFGFYDGLNIINVENEGGKTTLCALIRIMLYGLNTSKRDSKNALSDKSKYLPQDNMPMNGIMEIEYDGRDIIITRSTGKGGFMQEFGAYYKDTGEAISYFTARDLGYQLFDIGEEGFVSSAMIDGTDLSLSSDELHNKMLSMSTTGDTNALYTTASDKLYRWQLDINSGNGHGTEPETYERVKKIEKNIENAREIKEKIDIIKQDYKQLSNKIEILERKKEENDEQIRESASSDTDRLDALEKEIRTKIEQIKGELPPEKLIRAGNDAFFAYEGAVKLDKKRRERLALADAKYHKEYDEILELQKKETERIYKESKPKIRWWSLVIAAICGFFAGVTVFAGLSIWREMDQYLPFIFSGLTALFLILAFVGKNPEVEGPCLDFENELRSLKIKKQQIDQEQEQGAQILSESYEQLMDIGRKIDHNVEDLETVIKLIKSGGSANVELENEMKLLESVRQQKIDALKNSRIIELKKKKEEISSTLKLANERKIVLTGEISRLEGRLSSIGDLNILINKRDEFLEEIHELQLNKQAIVYAREVLKDINSTLSAKISPEISKYTRKYMEYLTDGRYKHVRLLENFDGECACENSVMLGSLRLSTGTRDQLYLSLRLAVCKVLLSGKENVPIIMDDPFITFDDMRQKKAVELLREIAKERQIIVLTSKKIV